jgi:hypothetical protein
MIEISSDKIAYVILEARELAAAMANLDESPSAIRTEDDAYILLERGSRDTTPSEFATFIAELNEDEQADLVAIVWIGRGTFSAEEFEEAVETAKAERTNPTEDYLLGIPLLADYLEAGMEKLGYTIEDIERDVL